MRAKSVQVVYMLHDGGTKDYHFIVLNDHVSGRSVLHTRWGKVGAGGQMGNSPTHADSKSIKNLLKKQMDARMKRGYAVISTSVYERITEMVSDDGPGMDSVSKCTALARTLDAFMADNSEMEVTDPADEFDMPSTPVPEPDRGALWGSW